MRRLVLFLSFLLFLSCEQLPLESISFGKEITIREAKIWFESTSHENSHTDRNFNIKKVLWSEAYPFDFGFAKAIVVPLEYAQNRFAHLDLKKNNLAAPELTSINEWNALLIYKVDGGIMQEEVLTVIPDVAYLANSDWRVKKFPFEGMLLINDWQGKFKNGFVFENGTITRQVISSENARLNDFIPSCVYIDWFSCPGGVTAPSPQCTYLYTNTQCSMIWTPGGGGGGGSGGFGGYGVWVNGGGGGNGGGSGSGGGGGVSAITNNNTLNPGDKEMLEDRYQEFLNRGCLNEKMSEHFVSNGIKFDFNYNPALPAPAAFAPAGQSSIYFRDSPSIQQDALSEELFHAYQHSYYQGGITQYYEQGLPNIEFEAKLYKDIISLFSGGATAGVPFGHPQHQAYSDWLDVLTNNRTKYPTSISGASFLFFLEAFKQAYPEYATKPSTSSLTGQALTNLVSTSNCPK